MPVKYIPYYPNTVAGQAILDNITRTQRVLRYRENDKVYDRIKRGMPYYEVEPIETVGNPSENLVIRGECISACAYLKEKGIKVDLVYIDPPFASGADYAKKVFLRKNLKLAKEIASAEQEMDIDELRAFEEKMYGDIWNKEDYLNWMYENLIAIKSIMSDKASIYVHLDWHIGHYVKILMDEVFGEENFLNEVVWYYPNSGMKASSSKFHQVTDNIFIYTKSEDYVFNKLKRERKDGQSKQAKRKFNSETGKADMVRDVNGKIIYQIIEEVLVNSMWEIAMLSNNPTENVGYTTQKPESLLQRVINASSDKQMIVADFFGGSGVAAKVANDLERKFIHVDIGINSIQTVRDRLVEAKADFQILEVKDGVSLFRNPKQTMDKLAVLIPGLQRNVTGINNFWFGTITEAKLGTVPVHVPNLLNTQEKVLDIPTINTIINQELQNLEINAKKVIVYYIDIDDQKAVDKFIKENNASEIEVELRDLKNLLHEMVLEDSFNYQLLMINDKEQKMKDEKDINHYQLTINHFTSDRLIQKINEFNQKGNLQSLSKGKKFDPISISEEGLELIELISLDCENLEGQWYSTTEIKIDKFGYVIRDGNKTKDFWDGKITSVKKPKRIKIRNISGDETIKGIG